MGTFNAVSTTGIYCLPSCSGRPNRHNVRTFELAAAAEAAGFRPCRRCRPYRTEPSLSSQSAPQLVCQAVRLIVDGVLDEATEDDLGFKLGVSGRHIRRLFVEILGVTPDQLARSTRVHFARRLLDDSDLSIADITFAAGFGSIRQFNRECRATFQATPSQLRAQRRRSDRLLADGGLALRLPFEPPFDWQAMLASMKASAIEGVEDVGRDHYRRAVIIGGDPGVLEIMPGGGDHLILRAHLPHWKGLIHIVQRARHIFNLDADIDSANHILCADPLVGALVTERPGIRPPGAWDAFEAGVEAVVTDRASASGGAAILGRIAACFGTPVPGLRMLGLTRTFPAPEDILHADLQSVGLDQPAIDAIRRLAKAASEHPAATDPTRDLGLALAEAIEDLTASAAQSLRLRLGDPDAFPGKSDRLLRAMSRRAGHKVTAPEARVLAEAWRPWRAHATSRLWSEEISQALP